MNDKREGSDLISLLLYMILIEDEGERRVAHLVAPLSLQYNIQLIHQKMNTEPPSTFHTPLSMRDLSGQYDQEETR